MHCVGCGLFRPVTRPCVVQRAGVSGVAGHTRGAEFQHRDHPDDPGLPRHPARQPGHHHRPGMVLVSWPAALGPGPTPPSGLRPPHHPLVLWPLSVKSASETVLIDLVLTLL